MRRHATTASATRGTAPAARAVPGPASGPAGDEPDPRGERVLAGYRLLRRVATGDRAEVHLAVDGTVETVGAAGSSDEPPRRLVALRVYGRGADDDPISVEIAAMGGDASGTLPALIDVAVLEDGRRVIAVERIGGPTLSRLLGERLLDPGEATTILAPLVAVTGTLADAGFVHTRLAAGDVVLDDTGRPRLVGLGALRRLEHAGGAVARTELLREGLRRVADLVDEVAASTRRPAVFEQAAAIARSGAEARPFARCEGEVERALFAAAAAMPVRPTVPRSAANAVPARVDVSPVEFARDALDAEAAPSRRRRGLRAVLGELAQLPAPFVDRVAVSADTASGAGVVRRARSLAAGRRRPLVVGGAIGAGTLVLLLTLVPSAGSADGAGRPAPAPESGKTAAATDAPASAAPSTQPEPRAAAGGDAHVVAAEGAAEPSADRDPVTAAADLLARRAECLAAIDASCLEQVDQPGSAIERADRGQLASAREGEAPERPEYDLDGLSVAAEMGDAVLLHVPYAAAEREPASLLVMRSEAGWRLRELFD